MADCALMEAAAPPTNPADRATVRRIAETALTEAVLYDGRADGPPGTLVIFNPVEFRAEGIAFWGQKVVEKTGQRTLALVSRQSHWYPRDDTLALIDAVLAAVDLPQPVICYGFSMGAHAALKFGNRLGARAVLAFSPQFSIEPDVIAGEWHNLYARHFTLALAGQCTLRAGDFPPNSIVIVDPHEPTDVSNANRLAREGSFRRIAAPRLAHQTVEAVASTARLAGMLDQVRAGASDAELTRGLLRNRKFAPTYLVSLATRLRRARRPLAALSVLARAPAHKHNVIALDLGIRLQLATPDEARALIDACPAARLANEKTTRALATDLLDREQTETACRLALRALLLHGHEGPLRLCAEKLLRDHAALDGLRWLNPPREATAPAPLLLVRARLLRALGFGHDAELLLRECLRLRPADTGARLQLGDLLIVAKRIDEGCAVVGAIAPGLLSAGWIARLERLRGGTASGG